MGMDLENSRYRERFNGESWQVIWAYTCVVTDDVLDEVDQKAGRYNDRHHITGEKSWKIADVLDERLDGGLKDDGAVREVFKIHKIPCPSFDRATEGLSTRSGVLPPLRELWRDSGEAARELLALEGGLIEFAAFCRKCGYFGGFRIC